MKRHRANSRPTPRRRKRPRVEDADAIAFMGLLPEMHGEIVARVYDVADRASLARTCTTMHALVKLPQLPQEWRFTWDLVKETATPARVGSASQALLEMVAFGVPRWPCAFRYGQFEYRPSKVRDGNFLTWQWRDDVRIRYFNVAWDVDKHQWEVRPVEYSYVSPMTVVGTLAALHVDKVAQWHDFLETPRCRPDDLPPIRPFEYDRD